MAAAIGLGANLTNRERQGDCSVAQTLCPKGMPTATQIGSLTGTQPRV